MVVALPENLVLKSGGHTGPDQGFCVMEAVAYVAGEPWSDRPSCACPVIGAFLRSWNDRIRSDEERTRLLSPLILKLVGTKATPEVELARVMLALDWVIRECAPTWLELVPKLKDFADQLRASKPIQSWDDVANIRPLVREARSAAAADAAAYADAAAAADAAAYAYAAAYADAAADAAAYADAAAAADAAAYAYAAAYADAAAAADAAAYAYAAAYADARKTIQPTKEKMQASAVLLVERMIAVK